MDMIYVGFGIQPLLFLIYINNIHPHLHKETKMACYVDDIAIWHSDKNLKHSEYPLNHSLEGISKWSNLLKLKINPQKTSCNFFSSETSIFAKPDPEQSTTIKNWKSCVLRTNFRCRTSLLWTCQESANKSFKKLRILKNLCGTNWGASPKTLKTTHAYLPSLPYFELVSITPLFSCIAPLFLDLI